MKIGIPVSDYIASAGKLLAQSFHHTSILGVYDTEKELMEVIDLEKENYNGGFSDMLKEREISVVISPAYSPVVLKLFKLMGVTPYKASGKDISMNISACRENQLVRYTFAEAMESMDGCDPTACGTCGSSC